ncbi:MAG: PD-(D/E)XK nuclease-like domain-containing protein [Stenotrophobium sp.]
MSARIIPDDEDYYAGGTTPALSQSIANTLLMKSPLHAWLNHPLLGAQPRAPTKAMDEGQLVHTLLLGKGAAVEIVNADNFRTKAAQEVRDNAIAAGMLPVLRRVYDEAATAVETLRANIAAFGISIDTNMAEIAIEWEEPGEFGPVLCRGKMDHVDLDRGVIIDVKKAENAHPNRVGRLMTEYGMDVQACAYQRALSALRPEHEGRTSMLFVFCELSAPYAVTPAQADGAMRTRGEHRWLRAVRTWERCLREDKWPAYTSTIVSASPPPWSMSDEILEGLNE